MASSGTITGSKTPGKVPTVEWEITSQNAGANTSTLKWWVKYSSAAGYSTFGTFSGTITIDGQAKAVSGTVSASGSGTIDSGTVTISHNADGTKSAAIKLVGGIAGTSGWPSSYKGLSGTASLDRIARPPAKPAAPSVSAQTASSFKAALGSAPSTNGSAITGYEWQRATNSGFTAGTASVSTGASTRNCTFSGLAANSDYWVRVRAKSAAGSSAWSAGTAVSTTPAAPAAPTSAAVVRVSDGSQTVSWVRNPTTIAPYTSQFVERRDDVNTAWVRVGSLNGTATSFTDTSTVANRRYDYRVQAENAGGKSAYSGTVSINTTPAAPTGVAAVKQGTSIVVSWVREAVQAGVTTHEVWDKPAGGAAVLVGTVGAVDTWTHSTPDAAKTHQYYVIAKAGALASAASVPSNVVQLAAPPLAPTRVAPVGVIDRGKTVVLQWKHNPVDTTVQSAFELQYRINGGAWVPVSGSTAQSYSLAAPGVSGTLEWQVRTKGQHASFGPWMAVSASDLASAPWAVLDSPSDGGTWLDSSLLVSWGYSNADGKVQSQWQVEVLRDGVLVESREGSGTASSVVVDSSLNNTAYLVRVRVRAASGLWSVWETAEVVTDYPLPVTVEPVPVFDPETGSNALTFTLPDTPETYAWAGVPHASTSTKTKDGVTLTNLFANASFEAAGGMVEVRRNLASSPRAATTFSWSAIGGTSGLTPNKPFTPVDAHCPTTCVQTVTTTTSGERALVSSLAGANLVTAGKTYTISLYWACSETASVGYRFAFLDAAGSVIGNLEYGSNQLGKSGRISITKTAPAGAVRLSIGAQISNAVVVPVGATFQATGVLIEDGAFLGDYLDGTYSPDSDLAPSWAGSADASESVLRGRLVTGAQSGGSGRVAVQSTTGVVSGGYSVRIINLNDPGSAAAGINVRNWGSADVGKTYTIAAYCTIPEGYDASQDIVAGVTNRSRGIYTYGNAQAGAQAPGDPGTHLVRAIIDVTTNDSSLRLGGGGLVAQSLMWDMLTIAEGAHPDLMPFDGDTQSTTDVETITVQRQIGDGSWVTIASDIQPDSAITDPLPVLNGPNRYRAISKTSLPSSADGPNIEHEINEQRWHYINHGPALDQVVRLGANDAETSDTNRDSETHAWAGQHLPTLYIGEARNRGLTYQGDLPPDGSPWPDVEALGWIDTEACYRTPAGRRAFVHIQSVSVARAPITGLRSASINMQEIQYTEGEVSGNNDLLQV